MADLSKYLIPAETPVVVTRRHWASMLKAGCVCAAALWLGLLVLAYGGATQAASGLGVLLVIGSLAWFAWNWSGWRHEKFIITDRRVLLVYGLLTHRIGVMPLSKVTDLTYERSLGGRLLGYGSFVVESAGQHQAFNKIEYLPNPDKLYHDVSVLLFQDRFGTGHRRPDHRTAPLPDDRWEWP